MAILEEIKTEDGGKGLQFYCPGCKYYHFFRVEKGPEGADRPLWTWNGSMEKPTFSPSLGVNMAMPDARCHSFVREGKIEFLSDCHHELRGQTVDLPEVD